MSSAELRNTPIEEYETYCLIDIFDVSMLDNYREWLDRASRLLEKETYNSAANAS
jgi:hypothetical protein